MCFTILHYQFVLALGSDSVGSELHDEGAVSLVENQVCGLVQICEGKSPSITFVAGIKDIGEGLEESFVIGQVAVKLGLGGRQILTSVLVPGMLHTISDTLASLTVRAEEPMRSSMSEFSNVIFRSISSLTESL